MPTWLITGTNRGLGLEFIRQLAHDPSNTILATTRPNADTTELQSLASDNTHILPCDLTSHDSITHLATTIPSKLPPNAPKKLDIIIANAGANTVPHHTILDLNPTDLHHEIDINVLGPATLTSTLLAQDLLSPSVKIINMSSGMGSLSYNLSARSRTNATYAVSKAALNMVSVRQSTILREKLGEGCVVVSMDPGWVRTRMGGAEATLGPEESIRGMLDVISRLEEKDNGRFLQYNGGEVGW